MQHIWTYHIIMNIYEIWIFPISNSTWQNSQWLKESNSGVRCRSTFFFYLHRVQARGERFNLNNNLIYCRIFCKDFTKILQKPDWKWISWVRPWSPGAGWHRPWTPGARGPSPSSSWSTVWCNQIGTVKKKNTLFMSPQSIKQTFRQILKKKIQKQTSRSSIIILNSAIKIIWIKREIFNRRRFGSRIKSVWSRIKNLRHGSWFPTLRLMKFIM